MENIPSRLMPDDNAQAFFDKQRSVQQQQDSKDAAASRKTRS